MAAFKQTHSIEHGIATMQKFFSDKSVPKTKWQDHPEESEGPESDILVPEPSSMTVEK